MMVKELNCWECEYTNTCKTKKFKITMSDSIKCYPKKEVDD